jgi:hypothetical protein
MKLKNIFTGFRNESLGQIAQLFADKKISEKEKYLFIATCENSINAITSIIDVFKAEKDLTEGDFNWLMNAYVSSCIRELYDIFEAVKRESVNSDSTGKIIKNAIDVDFDNAIKHFQIIIGREDVGKFFSTILEFIKSSDRDAKDFDEFLTGRAASVLVLFKENGVKLDSIPPKEWIEVAQKNYDDSIKNFIKICCETI